MSRRTEARPKANGQTKSRTAPAWPAPTILANVREIGLGQIEPDPDQPRQAIDPDELARLADTIRARGLLQPIRVRELTGEGHRYQIVAGERRWRAAELAGLVRIPCVVVQGEDDPVETLLDQVAENTGRLGLAPLEEARAFQRILEAKGWTQGQLAAQVGVNQSDVSKRLALLRLPGEVCVLIEDGLLDGSSAYELSKLADVWEQIDLAGLAVSNGWTRGQVAELVKLPAALRQWVRDGEMTIAAAAAEAREPTPSAPRPGAPATDDGAAAVAADATPGPPPAGPMDGQAGVPGTSIPERPAVIPGESAGDDRRGLERLCDRIEAEDAALRERGAHVRTALLEADDHHVTIVTGRDPECPALVTVTSNGEGHPSIARALWLALGEALRAWPEEWARCNRCSAPRPLGENPCRECGCPEFRIEMVGGNSSQVEG